jgi:hypothetical protein
MRLEGSATSRWFPPFETRPAAAPQGEVIRFERLLLEEGE